MSTYERQFFDCLTSLLGLSLLLAIVLLTTLGYHSLVRAPYWYIAISSTIFPNTPLVQSSEAAIVQAAKH